MSPVIELPTKNLIVPEDVTRGYLSGYDVKELAWIEELYQTIKKDAFSKVTDAPNAGASLFVLVAGTQGVGKTELVKKLLADRKEQFIVCDVDSILGRMPVVKAALKNVEHDLMRHHWETYTTEGHRTRAEAAVENYRNAAKYISDRLMNEAVGLGYNVIVETNAKTPNIGKFIDAVKASGVILDAHICDAPFRIIEGAENPHHGLKFAHSVLKAEHNAFRKNMAIIAEKCDQDLTLWARFKAHEGLSTVVVARTHTYVTDLVGKAAFEAHFADIDGRTVANLMGNRKDITQAPKPVMPDEFRVTV